MPDVVALTDARALRAYAHPVRLRLVGLLRREGALTATEAAARLGESSGTTSFHLRQLQRYGLVEEAGGGTGRRKPWRATAQLTSFPNVDATPEMAEASAQLRAVLAGRYHEQLLEWIAGRSSEPVAWQEATPFGDRTLHLTAAETAELAERIEGLLAAYADRDDDPAARPADARRVTWLTLAAPQPVAPAVEVGP